MNCCACAEELIASGAAKRLSVSPAYYPVVCRVFVQELETKHWSSVSFGFIVSTSSITKNFFFARGFLFCFGSKKGVYGAFVCLNHIIPVVI